MSALSTAARHEYYNELEKSLPTPVINQLEYRERRLATAVEAFEALRPGDAYEGRLAVRIVLCGAYAAECLREADCYRGNYAKRTHCRAQAASMMRGENSAKRMLEREQRVRLAAEAVTEAGPERPAAAGAPPQRSEVQAAPPPTQATSPSTQAASPPTQAAALAPSPDQAAAAVKLSVQTAAAAPPPVPVQPAATPPRPVAANRAAPPVQAASAPPPSPEAIAKAEAFALEDVVAAAQIRHDRGVTPRNKANFHRLTLPSDPAVIDALVRGGSAVLNVLDGIGGEMRDAAD